MWSVEIQAACNASTGEQQESENNQHGYYYRSQVCEAMLWNARGIQSAIRGPSRACRHRSRRQGTS